MKNYKSQCNRAFVKLILPKTLDLACKLIFLAFARLFPAVATPCMHEKKRKKTDMQKGVKTETIGWSCEKNQAVVSSQLLKVVFMHWLKQRRQQVDYFLWKYKQMKNWTADCNKLGSIGVSD